MMSSEETRLSLDEADAVLTCAGAGMSVKVGEMVYVNSDDFTRHYPRFTKCGYRTSYECMGLNQDPRVPPLSKVGSYCPTYAQHEICF